MSLWYSHQGMVVVRVTRLPDGYDGARAYEDRGWTSFERCCAELIKPQRAYVVEAGKTRNQGEWLWNMCIDTSARVGDHTAGRRLPTGERVSANHTCLLACALALGEAQP